MLKLCVFICIFVPIILGFFTLFDKSCKNLKRNVFLNCCFLIPASLILFFAPDSFFQHDRSYYILTSNFLYGVIDFIIPFLEFSILCLFLWIGIKRKHFIITTLAFVQLLVVFYIKAIYEGPKVFDPINTIGLTVDSLSTALILAVSFVGSLIIFYAIGYMNVHEDHLNLTKTKKPKFFFLMLFFIGAMNALVLANDLNWVYFFWEVTTLCSFLLIAHDDTEVSNKNANTALWINLLGGTAFALALYYSQKNFGTTFISNFKGHGYLFTSDGITKGLNYFAYNNESIFIPVSYLLPIALIIFAGFTKAAQVPFQKWLCGAMVAPTPVSALLHSSTMVKAGVYIIFRMYTSFSILLKPYSHDTKILSACLTIFGAFSFITAAALAVGQTNAKKILAYSTISNLGLIIACIGINTPMAHSAAILLILFHAVSKSVLFLCVGAIEQKIGSRNIEDMRGLFNIMPRTAMFTAFAIITMILPPFGMLLGKWMALEAATQATLAMPLVVAMIALGSGITILFWARFAGIILSSAAIDIKIPEEPIDSYILKPIQILSVAIAALPLYAPILYYNLIELQLYSLAAAKISPLPKVLGSYSLFNVYPLYLVLIIGLYYALKLAKKYSQLPKTLPYMSGVQAEKDNKAGFIGPMKSFVESKSSNYYLRYIFGEDLITNPINCIAIAIIAMMFGGVL